MANLVTVKQFVAQNSWCTESGIRHLIFKHAPRDRNNPISDHALQHAILRVGRKLLIDEPLFIEALRDISKAH